LADDYNIDNILSEVKKRREENEKRIKEAAEPAATPVAEESVQPEAEPETAPAVPEAPAVEAPAVETPVEAEKVAPHAQAAPAVEIPATEVTPAAAETVVQKQTELPRPAETKRQVVPEEGMTNLLDYAEEESVAVAEETLPKPLADKPKKATPADKKKRNKVLTAVIIVLAVLVLAAGVAAYLIVNGWLNGIIDNSKDMTVTVTESEWQGMKTLTENFDPIYETEATELASLEDMVKTWYYNGSPCSSSHVLNVMLIGEDTREEEISEEDTRADAAILASINIDTQQIMLTSVLRDSWAYYETEPGNEDTGRFSKLNEALSYGGLSTYLNAVEHLYKVQIDGYAIVNFSSFETIIDTLYPNGITLELTSKEINEINNHPETYGGVYIEKTFEGQSGELQLTGEQALAYCRIRHIDSDGARADRQKTTLMKIYEDMRDAGSTKLLSLINELIPYVKTSFNKNDIIKIGKYALSQGWTKFDIDTQNFPEYNVTGGIYKDFNNLWIWKSDFPADAYYMQTRIYNKSNITLASLRVDTQKVRRSGFYSKGDSATTATVRNEHYGEATSVPSQNPEDEEESTTTSN